MWGQRCSQTQTVRMKEWVTAGGPCRGVTLPKDVLWLWLCRCESLPVFITTVASRMRNHSPSGPWQHIAVSLSLRLRGPAHSFPSFTFRPCLSGFFSCCCQSFSLSYCQVVNKLEDCYIWIIATGDSHSDCINRVISFLQSGLIVLYNCFQRLQRTLLVPVLFALIKTCLWKCSLLICYIFLLYRNQTHKSRMHNHKQRI